DALGGRVFDVLGEAFSGRSLRDLLWEAIRYGEREDVRRDLFKAIDNSLDTERLKEIFRRHALVENHMGLDTIYAIKEEMDKAEARKLQPHFVRAFFLRAFERLGGDARQREKGRYELPHVPAAIRERDRRIGQTRQPVLSKYARICFEKSDVRVHNKPVADLIHPAHPLMAAIIDMTLEDCLPALKQGAVLVDPSDPGSEPHLLLMVDHEVREGAGDNTRTISREIQFVRIAQDGSVSFAGWAPHLDLRPATAAEIEQIRPLLDAPWLDQGLERRALEWAGGHLVPRHLATVRDRRLRHIEKVTQAVHERLTREINFLSRRAIELQEEVRAGKQPRVQPDNLLRRAEELAARLDARMQELEAQRHIVPAAPKVLGGALVVPAGWFEGSEPATAPGTCSANPLARSRIERLAMEAVMAAERAMGFSPRDVSAEKCGWDITSSIPRVGKALPDDRLIEVKGRGKGATTVTLHKY